jgi:hypothetical protein
MIFTGRLAYSAKVILLGSRDEEVVEETVFVCEKEVDSLDQCYCTSLMFAGSCALTMRWANSASMPISSIR